MADSKGSNQGFKKLPNIHARDKGASRSNQKQRFTKPHKAILPPTPEEAAAFLVVLKTRAEALEKAKVEAARLLALEHALPRMSFRQLSGTIRTFIRKERVPGLNIAEAICASIVLANTQTKENPFAKLSSYLR